MMTVLIALVSKDSLVMGCDSLGSQTNLLLNPLNLADYFEQNNGTLKIGADGKPLLKTITDLWAKTTAIPIEHMTHMTKLYSLEPLSAGLMTTGIFSIGERTVKSLIAEFKSRESQLIRQGDISKVANKAYEFINDFYLSLFKDPLYRPELEFILGGYGKGEHIAKIFRINFRSQTIKQEFENMPPDGIVFGGQFKEIARIVFGTDGENKVKINQRHFELLHNYREQIMNQLKLNGVNNIELPAIEKDKLLPEEQRMFSNNWDLNHFLANWGDFSEQNAIECVDFFVSIMIKSQQFSFGMPTVGGDTHIALITEKRFAFISKEEYRHGNHSVPKLPE
jgi:hypothetical protein